MNIWIGLLDAVLLLTLLWLAWRAVFGAGEFRAVVLFMAFGLLMALAWVRLRAVDVAIAEAAIGSGLTGALLLSTAAALEAAHAGSEGDNADGDEGGQ